MSTRTIPAQADVVLGTTHGRRRPPFRLTPSAQCHHGLIWGSTGTGKSKLLQSIFLQHLNKGNGVCLIDPHADLATGCLSYLTSAGFFQNEHAFDRLIYIDFPDDTHVPFNVLRQRFDPHTTALNTLEAVTRAWKDLQSAPLFKTLFLASSLTLAANGLPLTDLYQLLLDSRFREACLNAVSDPLVHQTFAFYERSGKGQAASTLRRAFLLSFSPVARGCLGQAENWLDFRAIMDSGKSLIINLGSIADPITRRLLGCLIMVQIEQAALSRVDLPPGARRGFTCLVDEWPSFLATQAETIENVLEQTRKFNLRLYLAAQSLAQVDSKRLAGALENCRLSITFRLGRDSAVIQAKYIGNVDPFKIKTLPRTFHQSPKYMSASEQQEQWVQALVELPPQEAYVKLGDQPAVRIKTLVVEQRALSDRLLDTVIAEYRRRYQKVPEVRVSLPTPSSVAAAGVSAVVGAAQAAPTTELASSILNGSSIYETIGSTHLDLSTLFGEDIDTAPPSA